jgi:flagellar protein FlbT
MYLAHNPGEYHTQYFKLVSEIQDASPSSSIFFMQINDHIINSHYYKAMKVAKELIQHEKELLDHALKQPEQ